MSLQNLVYLEEIGECDWWGSGCLVLALQKLVSIIVYLEGIGEFDCRGSGCLVLALQKLVSISILGRDW